VNIQRFSKLHGAGNDFVLIGPEKPVRDPASLALLMADRHTGVGFDQLMLIEPAEHGFAYRVFNADGSSAQQCGNGARAVAFWLLEQGLVSLPFSLQSPVGAIKVRRLGEQLALSLGRPNFDLSTLPFLAAVDRNSEPIMVEAIGQSWPLRLMSLGNPHATLLVDNCALAPVDTLGAALQSHRQFPDRVNVGFVQPITRELAKLRVYERGAGETLACGSGACAAAVQLIRAGLAERTLVLELPGGRLTVNWPNDQAEVELAGPVKLVFRGEFTL
jgi:diaminopimelate epimerase